METTCRVACFGKVADPQPAILSERYTPLQISFNLSVCILGAFFLENRPQRKKVTILKFTVCYIAIHFQPLKLVRLND